MATLRVGIEMHLLRVITAAAVVALSLSALSGTASADRLPAPETTICNKSRAKAYVATGMMDTYVGWSTEGWRYIKPGACSTFRADIFHVRGKRKLVGTSTKTQPGCITLQKVFRIESGQWDATSEAACKKEEGRVVPFWHPKPGKKTRVLIKR